MDVPLRIERDPKGGAHGDLRIRVASCEHRSDSYYYDIDQSATAPPTIEEALARLLDQWLGDLAQLDSHDNVAFLPFDLSDQCSAWLRVAGPARGGVTVELGWTSVEGWSFVPSNYGDAASKIGTFEPIPGAIFDARLDDLKAQIIAMRDGFRSGTKLR